MNTQELILGSQLDDFLNGIPEKDNIGVIRPGGNHGDSLIYMGLEGRLDELEVNYTPSYYFESSHREVVYKFKRKSNQFLSDYGWAPFRVPDLGHIDHLYLHGGGNMTDLYPGVLEMLETLFKVYPETPLIIGPQSYYFEETDFRSLLAKHDPTIRLFCREKYSKKVLMDHGVPDVAQVKLSPDTAFYLDAAELREHADDSALDRYGLKSGEYTLLALRDDVESVLDEAIISSLEAQIDGSQFRFDISTAPTFGTFVALADHADYIYTDRLHGGILSAILGKRATLIENSYHKSRGVYEYSLSKCDGIEFLAPDDLR